jgi:exosortase
MSVSETLPPAGTAGAGNVPPLPAEARPSLGAIPWALGLVGVALLGGIAFLFAGRFRELYALWNQDPNYSHGFLVPLVGAYLAWVVLRRQGLTGEGDLRAGLLWVVVGCALHLWAVIVWWPPVDFIAVAALLYGFAVLAGGRRWAAGFLFPILFLFFMFPLSPVLLDLAARKLQAVVSTLAVLLLQLFVPAYQIGNNLVLPGQPLKVGEQCSGLRQVVAFAALTLLVAYLSQRRWPFRVGIVLAGLPVAVAANLLRVLLMAFLVLHFGAGAISETDTIAFGISYHTAWGLLTMAVGLLLLLGVAWWLGRAFPETPPAAGAGSQRVGPAVPDAAEASGTAGPPDAPRSPRPIVLSSGLVWRLGAALLVLAVAAAAQWPLTAHLQAGDALLARLAYMKQPLRPINGATGFPVSLGAWIGGPEVPPDPATRPSENLYYSNADDRLNRVYTLEDDDGKGVTCQLWMIHYRNGQDRQHHPLICYTAEGWTEDESGREALAMTEGEPIRRFCFTRDGATRYLSYVYYWHYTFEPPEGTPLSPWQRMHAEWAVRPSLTLEVFTTARTPEQLARAAEFVRLVDERLQDHLPPGARRGSETLPMTAKR